MNNAVFVKTMQNVTKQSCHNRKKTKLFGVRTKFLYYTVFHRKYVSNRNEKKQILMKKPVYLGVSILELSKILMYQFCNNYVKPKYDEKAKLRFFVYIKTDDIYKNIAKDGENRFDTSNYELDRPLPKGQK